MLPGFKFERALAFGFSAPHVRSFPWFIALANGLGIAGIWVAAFFASKAQVSNLFSKVEAAFSSGPEAVFSVLKDFWIGVWPIVGVSILAYWVVSSIITTATMRRYIRDEGFSLRFGGDEIRMMTVQLFWTLLTLVLFLPMLLVFVIFGLRVFLPLLEGGEPSTMEVGTFVAVMAITMLFMVPVYVFFATRLVPCFALTVKERQVRFFDAWHVTRGRFWPLLGSYVILAIGGGVVVSVLNQIVQSGVGFALPFDSMTNINSVDDVVQLLFSPGLLIGFGLLVFVQTFFETVSKHFAAAPAALAARYDPRNDFDMERSVDVFS